MSGYKHCLQGKKVTLKSFTTRNTEKLTFPAAHHYNLRLEYTSGQYVVDRYAWWKRATKHT